MKGKRKILGALALVAVLSSAMLLPSCSNGTPSETSGNSSNAATTSADGGTESKTHNLKILGSENINEYIKWSERESYPVWQEFQKLLDDAGIVLEYETVPSDQYKVVIQTRMSAGSKLPDIVNISPLDTVAALTLAKQGVILEVGSLIDQYSDGTINATIDKYYPNSRGLVIADDGKQYWFPSQHYSYMETSEGLKDVPSPYAMMIREDWLTDLNLPVPTTVDEFADTLTAFREQDANGNGKADEVIVMDPGSFMNGIAQSFGLAPDLIGIDVTNGKAVTPWYQEGVKEYFQYMNGLVESGVFDTTGFANINETRNQKTAENQLSANYTYSTVTGIDLMVTNDEDVYYMPIEPLKANDSITPYMVKEAPTLVWEKYAITKACEDLEGAIKLFDVVHSEKYLELSTWGVEGNAYTIDDQGVPTSIVPTKAEEQAAKKSVNGNSFFGGYILPRMQARENSPTPPETHTNEYVVKKSPFAYDHFDYDPWYVDSNDNFLALPTEEENQTMSEIITALDTYSQELHTKLILGEASLDNWDEYIAQFKKLGLDTLVEINSARLQRYLDAIK